MSNDWFRSWHGAPNDPKWIVIGRKAGIVPALAAWVGWALFDYASQSSQRGSIDGFDCESQAAWGGLEETQVVSCLETMTARGMIVAGRLANWEKRQPARERPEDNSTDRVRAMREKNKETKALQEQQADVTPCNATKRLDKIRLDTDTDTDTDTSLRSVGAGASAPPKPQRSKPKIRSALAEDAQPTERDKLAASEAGLTEERFRVEWQKFRSHHVANGSLMANWNAAWLKWLGNVNQFTHQARAGPVAKPATKDPLMMALGRIYNDLPPDKPNGYNGNPDLRTYEPNPVEPAFGFGETR